MVNLRGFILICVVAVGAFIMMDGAEGARYGRFEREWLRKRFREAPAYRNGKGCGVGKVEIAMTLDEEYLRGSMAAVFSLIKHASCPQNIFFHFLVAQHDLQLRTVMQSVFPYLNFELYVFDENLVKDLISSSVRKALEKPLNYARIYLADVLPASVERVIYLDSDVIAIDEIEKLWGIELGENPIGAPEYCGANLRSYFTEAFWSEGYLAKTFEGRRACYFNTGVMVMNLAKWRENKYRGMVEEWMRIQKEKRIYELGSLPPFLLVFGGMVKPLEQRWNQHGLGGDNALSTCRSLHPGPVSLMHWSGKGKPWLRLHSKAPCPLDFLWAPYDLLLHPQ